MVQAQSRKYAGHRVVRHLRNVEERVTKSWTKNEKVVIFGRDVVVAEMLGIACMYYIYNMYYG